jgi:hypothetical protein
VASYRPIDGDTIGDTSFPFEQLVSSLWIDALCIDQKDTTERNHQVQQMGEIFSKAEFVIAWMGMNLNIAFFIADPAREFRSETMDARKYFRHFQGSMDFFHSVYWERAWITQEVRLAKRVYCLATATAGALRSLGFKQHLDMFRKQDQGKQLFRDTVTWSHKSDRLLDNLCRFGKKNCSDRRDLVYSLLAISRDGGRLRVDYNLSRSQLAHDILWLYEQGVCIWHVREVLQTLQMAEELQTNAKVCEAD